MVSRRHIDLQALGTKLIGNNAGGAAILDRLKSLKPHVDFNRIGPGIALLVPNVPELDAELTRDAVSPAGDALADFAKQAQAGFELPAERLRGAGEGLKSDRDAISSAVRIAAVKRLIEGDPLLKKQLEDAGEAWNNVRKDAQEAADQLDALRQMVSEELAVLGARLRDA